MPGKKPAKKPAKKASPKKSSPRKTSPTKGSKGSPTKAVTLTADARKIIKEQERTDQKLKRKREDLVDLRGEIEELETQKKRLKADLRKLDVVKKGSPVKGSPQKQSPKRSPRKRKPVEVVPTPRPDVPDNTLTKQEVNTYYTTAELRTFAKDNGFGEFGELSRHLPLAYGVASFLQTGYGFVNFF